MIRVLFVCLGNICRSPMAEAVFQHKVREAGLNHTIESDSAGTGHWHIGAPPHVGTRGLLQAKQIPYSHMARQIGREDLERFEYIVTMDEMNRQDVLLLGAGPARIHSFMDFAQHLDYTEVPDPYHTGKFEEVYLLVDQAADGLLKAIIEEQGLKPLRPKQ